MGLDPIFGSSFDFLNNFDFLNKPFEEQVKQMAKNKEERSKCCCTCKNMKKSGMCNIFKDEPKNIIPNYTRTFKCGCYEKKPGIYAELAPCPCCNSDELSILARLYGNGEIIRPEIRCRSCGINMRSSMVHDNITDLVKKWNKRPFTMNIRTFVEVPEELREGVDIDDWN